MKIPKLKLKNKIKLLKSKKKIHFPFQFPPFPFFSLADWDRKLLLFVNENGRKCLGNSIHKAASTEHKQREVMTTLLWMKRGWFWENMRLYLLFSSLLLDAVVCALTISHFIWRYYIALHVRMRFLVKRALFIVFYENIFLKYHIESICYENEDVSEKSKIKIFPIIIWIHSVNLCSLMHTFFAEFSNKI